MMKLLYKRPDGSFVAEVNGLPYHVEAGSALFEDAEKAAKQLGNALQYEPMPEALPLSIADYEAAIQGHVDDTARSRQFRDGVTMASYASSTNPQWAAEAHAFIAWRDAVWAFAYAELAKVQAGEREQPSIDQFLAELPAVNWP